MPHLTAISVMMVWGATFVSTKVLLSHGLSPSWIFFIRFATAYIGLWALCFRYPVRPATGPGSSVGPAIGHSTGPGSAIGSALILAGVILAGKRRKITKYE